MKLWEKPESLKLGLNLTLWKLLAKKYFTKLLSVRLLISDCCSGHSSLTSVSSVCHHWWNSHCAPGPAIAGHVTWCSCAGWWVYGHHGGGSCYHPCYTDGENEAQCKGIWCTWQGGLQPQTPAVRATPISASLGGFWRSNCLLWKFALNLPFPFSVS